MTVNLPIEPAPWPIFRVLTCGRWSAGTSEPVGYGPWKVERMQSSTKRPDDSGLRVLSYSRCLLPQTGTARLAFSYGRFLDKIVGAVVAGANYNAETDEAKAPDLTGKEIQIQAAMPTGDPKIEPAWKVVFWGACEYQLDGGQGAAAIPAGERIYHLVDGLDRLKRWPLNSHHFREDPTTYTNAYGHPGYNISDAGDQTLMGNKSATTATTRCNKVANAHSRRGTKWTDKEAIENAIAHATPAGEPLFEITGSVGALALLDQPSAHPVSDEMTALDFLNRAVSRGKGNGAVGLYLTNSGDVLTVTLKIFPQITYDVTYKKPSDNSSVTLQGAKNAGTAVEVDLIGDHRFVDGSLMLGDPRQYNCDYNETLGEQIQSLVTVGFPDNTLQEDWTTAEATAFRALALTNRRNLKWFPVYQSYRIKSGTDWKFGDGVTNPGGTVSCAFSCDDAGKIVYTAVTSPGTVEIMDDLPLYEGYKYDPLPARNDGTAETGNPARLQPFFFFKNGADRLTPGTHISESLTMKIHQQTIAIYKNDDQAYGSRYISDPAYSVTGFLGTQYDYHNLSMTLGLRLPHRVRLASGTPGSARTRRTIIPGHHLWVSGGYTVWDYSFDSGDKYIPDTYPASGNTGILRDDRDALARLHFLSVAWYGPASAPENGGNTDERVNSSWSLRCCPDIPSSVDYDGGACVYPMIGQCVEFIFANGQYNAVLTPVSSITYDNESGIATWTTDWQDLDFQ